MENRANILVIKCKIISIIRVESVNLRYHFSVTGKHFNSIVKQEPHKVIKGHLL